MQRESWNLPTKILVIGGIAHWRGRGGAEWQGAAVSPHDAALCAREWNGEGGGVLCDTGETRLAAAGEPAGASRVSLASLGRAPHEPSLATKPARGAARRGPVRAGNGGVVFLFPGVRIFLYITCEADAHPRARFNHL